MAGMKCSNCGSPLTGNEKFCPNCGAPVAGGVQDQAAGSSGSGARKRRAFHIEPMEWDLDGYPAYTPVEKDPEETKEQPPVEFSWGTEPLKAHMDLPHYRELDEEEDEREARRRAAMQPAAQTQAPEAAAAADSFAQPAAQPEALAAQEQPEAAPADAAHGDAQAVTPAESLPQGEAEDHAPTLEEIFGAEEAKKAEETPGTQPDAVVPAADEQAPAPEAAPVETAPAGAEQVQPEAAPAQTGLGLGEEPRIFAPNPAANAAGEPDFGEPSSETPETLEAAEFPEAQAAQAAQETPAAEAVTQAAQEAPAAEAVTQAAQEAQEAPAGGQTPAADAFAQEAPQQAGADVPAFGGFERTGVQPMPMFSPDDDAKPQPIDRTPEEDEAVVEEKAQSNVDRIDKFYTYSKKNEEFQALLEREYSRLMGGNGQEAEGSQPGFADVMAREQKADALEAAQAQGQSQSMSGQAAQPAPDLTPAGPDGQNGAGQAQAQTQAPATGSHEAAAAAIAPSQAQAQAQAEAPKAEKKGLRKRHMTEEQKKDFEEVFHGPVADEDAGKSHKVLKVIAAIILILIILEILVIVLKWKFPESAASLKIQEIYNSIFETVRGWFSK